MFVKTPSLTWFAVNFCDGLNRYAVMRVHIGTIDPKSVTFSQKSHAFPDNSD